MDWQNLFLGFDGRINRKPYWLGVLCIIVASIVLTFGVYLVLGLSWETILGADARTTAAVNLIVTALVIYPSVAVMVKRLHDRNRSGWWAIVLYAFVVFAQTLQIAGFGGTAEAPSPISLGLGIVYLIMGIWLLIELGFLKGTQGPNRHGPDPLGAEQADASL